ncbi:MAG: GNAT family N-acetyltransferase [Anaerolineales bacterium]|jgi:RimJ/RimL family protein N-acetyltransferase|nr:GNAT family N-acetyltransferase [Anaerolineales bacterium]
MKIQDPLFDGESICLGAINHETDAEIEAKWTEDPIYMRMLSPQPFRPAAAAQVKKRYEAIEKEIEESHSLFYFTIRSKGNDRLIGFVRLFWVDWTNGGGHIQIGIGDANDRQRGYGTQALRLVVDYAFGELNLYRLSAIVPEYNLVALHAFQKLGFIEEVRRRKAYARDGQRWDAIHLGLLRSEWQVQHGDVA